MVDNIRKIIKNVPIINKKLFKYEKKFQEFSQENRSEVLWMYRTFYKIIP